MTVQKIVMCVFISTLVLTRTQSLFAVVKTQKVSINEVCLEPEDKKFPKWIELLAYGTTEMKGWSLSDRNGTFYRFENSLVLKKGEFLLLCFYSGDKISDSFAKKYGFKKFNVKPINVQSATPFNVQKDYVEAELKKKGKNGFLRSLKNEIKSWGSIEEIEAKTEDIEITNPLFFIPKDRRVAYQKKTSAFVKRNSIPQKYSQGILFHYAYHPNYSDEICLWDKSENLISYICWGRGEDTWPNRGKAIEKKLWDRRYKGVNNLCYPFALGGGGNETCIFFQRERYEIPDSEHVSDVSPGLSQPQKTFENICFAVSRMEKRKKGWIYLDSKHYKQPYGFDFQISPDENFKNIIYQKSEPVKSRDFQTRIYFADIGEKEFNNLLWHPELYYRIRRILPDGYKTEWAGGECGKTLKEAYKHHKDYKAAKAEEKVWDEAGALEKKRGELREKNDELRKSQKKTNNKKKIADLNKKIEENVKQIEDLNKKIKECYKRIRAF